MSSYQVDPERPATYVTQSRTPDSFKAFITPENPTIALKPPPDPRTAITGTCTKDNANICDKVECYQNTKKRVPLKKISQKKLTMQLTAKSVLKRCEINIII